MWVNFILISILKFGSFVGICFWVVLAFVFSFYLSLLALYDSMYHFSTRILYKKINFRREETYISVILQTTVNLVSYCYQYFQEILFLHANFVFSSWIFLFCFVVNKLNSMRHTLCGFFFVFVYNFCIYSYTLKILYML